MLKTHQQMWAGFWRFIWNNQCIVLETADKRYPTPGLLCFGSFSNLDHRRCRKKGNKLNWIRREEKKIASKLVFARKSLSTSKFRFDRSVFWRAFLNRDLKPFFRKSFKIRSKFDIVLVLVHVVVVAVAVIVVVIVVDVVVVDRSFGSRTQFFEKRMRLISKPSWSWLRSGHEVRWHFD